MAGWRRAVLHGGGVARVGNLPALLSELSLVPRAQAEASSVDGVLAWGRKPSAIRAEAWARARGLPLVRLEDDEYRARVQEAEGRVAVAEARVAGLADGTVDVFP